MSYNENNDIVNDEIVETKPIKKQYKPIDPNYNNMYYHKKNAPVEYDVCGCSVVIIALYNHKKSGNYKLVKHFTDIAMVEHDELKLLQHIIHYNYICFQLI